MGQRGKEKKVTVRIKDVDAKIEDENKISAKSEKNDQVVKSESIDSVYK